MTMDDLPDHIGKLPPAGTPISMPVDVPSAGLSGTFHGTVPPRHVFRALKRITLALDAGRTPRIRDVLTVQEWVDTPDGSYYEPAGP